MLLRKVVREKIDEYFNSPHWVESLATMERGRNDVRHAHVYCDSALHPTSVRSIIAEYFQQRGQPVERKIGILSHGRGSANVYYIQPPGICHFEVFLRYNPDVVLEPMPAAASRGGSQFDYWDKAFMSRYYQNFDFKPMNAAERSEVEAYFQSDAWKQIYGVMAFENERSVHSHCIVETSLHPEEILPLGQKALEARGWEVDRGVSVVFGVNGLDQGKITYLLRKPEIVLELEWEHNPDVVIKPAVKSLARITTTDMVERDLQGIDYIELNADDIAWFGARQAAARSG